MRNFKVYRDTPKRGETDSKWCGYVTNDGHITHGQIGFETEAEAVAYFEAFTAKPRSEGEEA